MKGPAAQGKTPAMSDPPVRTAYIAFGSNLSSAAGGPSETLEAAIKTLAAQVDVVAVSSFYETEPVVYPDYPDYPDSSECADPNTSPPFLPKQPPFINGVVEVRTAMLPSDLMQSLLQIEREFGRDRTLATPKGPRTLDLDLLLMEDVLVSTSLLTLPHPAMALRRFVLAPLTELAAGMRHPRSGKRMSELLDALPATGPNGIDAVRKIGRKHPPL